MRPLLAFAAAFALAGTALHAQLPAAGTIAGRVVLTGRVRGSALPSSIYQPRTVAHHRPAGAAEITNVVISLADGRLDGPLPPTPREIQQVHEEFVPRVVAVTRGSSVAFPNEDPIFHNVFSLASAATFDLGRYPRGRSKSVTLTKPGIVKVYCHIHSQMSATIVVFDHPYFTTPAADGTFVLRGVPAGAHTIVGWHERIGERAVTLTVAADAVTTVTLQLPIKDAE